MINNKKGFFPAISLTLTVGTLIVIAIIVALLFGGTYGILYFIGKYALTIAGLFLLVTALVLGIKTKSKTFPVLFGLIGVVLILAPFIGLQQSIFGDTTSVNQLSQTYFMPISLILTIIANIFILVSNKKGRYKK